MKTGIFVTGLACLFSLWACASQDDVAILGNRLAQVEEQHTSNLKEQENEIGRLQKLQKDRAAIEEQIRSQAAQLRVLIEELRVEMGRLSGQMEESAYHLKQRIRALEEAEKKRMTEDRALAMRVSANQERLAQVVSYLNLEPVQPAPAEPSSGDAPGEPVPGQEASGQEASGQTEPGQAAPAADQAAGPTDAELYAVAKRSFDNKGFEAALDGFQKLIKAFPKSEHADNAQFWIGEIYYREKWYEKAILEYQKVIENYPKGNKVKAALLKQGFAFFNLGDKDNARLILRELVRKYPDANESVVAKKKLLEIK